MLEVIHFADSGKGACYKFRVANPMKYLNQTGEVEAIYSERWDAKFQGYGHVFVFQRNSTKEALQVLYNLHNAERITVFDMDDDIFHIPEDNPVYNLYLHNPQTAWHQVIGIRYATAVTVSCEKLKTLYEQINPNVHILPNCIDMDDWADIQPILRETDAVRIFWGGSPTHKKDMEEATSAIAEVYRKHGDGVEIIIMGGGDDEAYSFPVLKFPFGTYDLFQRVMMSCDIGIAPMVNNLFNLGKSDLRLKELGMANLAIVSSDVGEYNKPESGAIVCDSDRAWFVALDMLVSDAERRALSAKCAREWAETWDISRHIHLWKNLYEELVDGYGRGDSSKGIRIQGPKRFTGKVARGSVRVGNHAHTG